MRIVFNELKKVWTAKIIAIIAVLCVLYFMWFMDIYITSYPKYDGSMNIGAMQVEYAYYLTNRFGSPLEQHELEELLYNRYAILLEVSYFMQSSPVFAQHEIFTYDDFERLLAVSSANNTEMRTVEVFDSRSGGTTTMFHFGGAYMDAMFVELLQSPVYLWLQVFDGIVEMYRDRDDWIGRVIQSNIAYNAPLREAGIRRLGEIRDTGEHKNIITPHILLHTLGYLQRLAVLVVLATLVLVSQLITTDRANKVNRLQYASKQGRKILKKQLTAILISAVGITTLLVIISARLFSITGAQAFWGNGINSFMGFPLHWLSITYGQYILLIVAVIYLLSIGTAAFAFILSRFSQNKVKLIFKVIPIFVPIILLSNWVLSEFLSIFADGNILIELFMLLVYLAVGIGLAAFVVARERRVELL